METILQPPQWPASLSRFVTWCLMWDPKNRPTSTQALDHEFFADAVDPLRPKSSASRILGRKQSDLSQRTKDGADSPRTLTSKPSWFRRSLIGREALAAATQSPNENKPASPRPPLVQSATVGILPGKSKARPEPEKRLTWTNGLTGSNGAPMPILPTIRPISPLSDAVTAQANGRSGKDGQPGARDDGGKRRAALEEKAVKKIGRQLSVASHGNHYADVHRQEAERALNGNGGLVSPPSGQKESFFSHLRKRARRLSGRNQLILSPSPDDVEARAGCGPWTSNRSSMAVDSPGAAVPTDQADPREVDRALRCGADLPSPSSRSNIQGGAKARASASAENGTSKPVYRSAQDSALQSTDSLSNAAGPVSSRTRRALQKSSQAVPKYETPDEAEELLNDIIHTAHAAVRRLEQKTKPEAESGRHAKSHQDPSHPPLRHRTRDVGHVNPYPTPSPSGIHENGYFGLTETGSQVSPINIKKSSYHHAVTEAKWPTPPYEENEWASAAAASICAAGAAYR